MTEAITFAKSAKLYKKGINEGLPLFKDQLCLNFRVVSNEGFAIVALCSVLVSDGVGVVLCACPFWGHCSHHRSALGRTTTLFTFRTVCTEFKGGLLLEPTVTELRMAYFYF